MSMPRLSEGLSDGGKDILPRCVLTVLGYTSVQCKTCIALSLSLGLWSAIRIRLKYTVTPAVAVFLFYFIGGLYD